MVFSIFIALITLPLMIYLIIYFKNIYNLQVKEKNLNVI